MTIKATYSQDLTKKYHENSAGVEGGQPVNRQKQWMWNVLLSSATYSFCVKSDTQLLEYF